MDSKEVTVEHILHKNDSEDIVISDFDGLLEKIDIYLNKGYIPSGNFSLKTSEIVMPGLGICKYRTVYEHIIHQKMISRPHDYTHSLIVSDGLRFSKSDKFKLIGGKQKITKSLSKGKIQYRYYTTQYLEFQLMIT